jgi:hypothetical protein
MKTVVARIERIRSGHSDRALVHAIDKKGREYKLEVSNDEVSELPPGEGHLLVMSWSIHESPIQPTMGAPMPQATPSATPTAQAPPAPSSVDAQFMALMSGRGHVQVESEKYSDNKRANLADVRADGTQSPQGITPDEQLANMLGMPRDSKPTT